MNILIIRLSAIGDVVHTLPAVHLLKKHLPGCLITWVVEEGAAGLVAGYAGIDRVIVSRRRQWPGMLGAGRLLPAVSEAAALVRELRREAYDLVLDFQGLFKSAVLAGLARGRRKIGFAGAREGAALFYNERAAAPVFSDHAMRRHMGLLRHLDISDDEIAFSPLFAGAEEAAVAGLLAGAGVAPGEVLVSVHPTGTWPTKCWAEEKTAALCDGLQEEHGCRVVLVGAAAEAPRLAAVSSAMKRPAVNLAGRTTLRELACLLSRSALAVTMDSGPMHLACAAGSPVVAVFGPTAPWRTGPFGSRHSVVRKDLPCSPCFKRKACPRGHHRCMGDIGVEEVLQVCSNYLGRERPRCS